MSRLATGGRIERGAELAFTFDGTAYLGCAGDTLASALLANDVHLVSRSVKYGRPRGIVAAGVEDPTALVQLEYPFPEPMVSATTVELFDGLVARGLAGQGRLAPRSDPARYDASHTHCDLLVVGAGPAGLLAALTAARSGARVVLVDDQHELGGSLLSEPAGALHEWVSAVQDELTGLDDVLVLSRTTAFGYYDDGFVLACERRTDHLGAAAPPDIARQRIWRIRARQVLLATGAHERPVVFADNDRPGIMLAGAARSYLNRYAVLAGRTVVLFTTHDGAYPAAFDLAGAGAAVSVIDARAIVSAALSGRCADLGIALHPGHVVTGSSGTERVTAALVAPWTRGQPEVSPSRSLPCDLLLVSGGWNPAVHLFSQARGRLRYEPAIGAFVPGSPLPGLRIAGAAAGTFTLAGCLSDAASAAADALSELGKPVAATPWPPVASSDQADAALVLWAVPPDAVASDALPPDAVASDALPSDPLPSDALPSDPLPSDRRSPPRFVDLQRDATYADVLQATGAGLTSVEHVKRYTTIGTAHDQGKTSGVIASGIVADALGVDIAELGTTTFRPPYTSIAFAALAGRDRGALFDPVRVTSIHPWHVEHGARFENVGQWKRPWYYPQLDSFGEPEDLDAAVLRECTAARTGVAMMDGSTLGKITVQGHDAAEFLDRLYTNLMSTVKPGCVRYGVLCGLDGMIIDDGTVLRVSSEEFLLTTTTGNAAMVLEWMEEFAQTEWPDLRVSLTSVTEQWATIPLVGPCSRAVLAAVAPELAVSNEAFPFMTWRDAAVAGVPARVCRISFSGELAYEINVVAWYGPAVWKALYAAGEPYGITPYGTETMHVLRAEKGYPIIGQDTDGTVTPQDLGMDWVVSKKKPDFVGRRSFARAENLRPDRKQLVGLLPVDPDRVLVEGAQLLADQELPPPPVPMLGHVTSSYRSAALGRTFALALLKGGRDRIGQTVHVWHDGELTPARVTSAVLYDPEGTRRDG
jgi:sarcosine oxidase subunit alpha